MNITFERAASNQFGIPAFFSCSWSLVMPEREYVWQAASLTYYRPGTWWLTITGLFPEIQSIRIEAKSIVELLNKYKWEKTIRYYLAKPRYQGDRGTSSQQAMVRNLANNGDLSDYAKEQWEAWLDNQPDYFANCPVDFMLAGKLETILDKEEDQ